MIRDPHAGFGLVDAQENILSAFFRVTANPEWKIYFLVHHLTADAAGQGLLKK
jgi:hypothetical protein